MVWCMRLASSTAGVAVTGLIFLSLGAGIADPVVPLPVPQLPSVTATVTPPTIMPIAGWLTSKFSYHRYHPILHKYRPHLGIDIAAPYGTVVVAPASGTVIRVARAKGYGRVMDVDHGNGIMTRYGHLSRFLAHKGDTVVRGQAIARVGRSGLATGPHLHYEVHVDGMTVDPLKFEFDQATEPATETSH
jgi:murein DD-endopeptidase MepM/ murein hydrolase activator NlpD